MSEFILRRYQTDYEIDYFESEEEFEEYLEAIAPLIGWIIIYFNSLEEHICDFLRMGMLRDPFCDERLDIFLAEMQYAAKCRALIHLYGQMIESSEIKVSQDELNKIEIMLNECSKRRNEYAHADWIGVRKENLVRVKTHSKKQGIFYRYRKLEFSAVKIDVEFINNARHVLCEFNDRFIC